MKFKAQGLVEIGLLFAFVAIIAIAVMSPLGAKMGDTIKAMAPHKATTEFNPINTDLAGSASAAKAMTANITTLANSSNTEAQAAANFVKDTLEIASKVNSGMSKNLSDSDVSLIAKSIKDNPTVETSGSLANIVATNTDALSLTGDEETTLANINSALSDNLITVDTGSANLSTAFDDFANAAMGSLDASILESYNLDSDDPILNIANAILLADLPNLPPELEQKANIMKSAFKEALSLE